MQYVAGGRAVQPHTVHVQSLLLQAAADRLHDLSGLHAQRGEVAAPVNGNRLAQERIQPLHLRPGQPTQVTSEGGR